eukprot:gb/GECG01011819.1/.p1 GENE.gb/GECG01011819.1/~~gb/GECG01011819.1/.p1  ORF type:complete len:121 (+),score=8.69 gb/GECG01011819.1/:1-363(+)
MNLSTAVQLCDSNCTKLVSQDLSSNYRPSNSADVGCPGAETHLQPHHRVQRRHNWNHFPKVNVIATPFICIHFKFGIELTMYEDQALRVSEKDVVRLQSRPLTQLLTSQLSNWSQNAAQA